MRKLLMAITAVWTGFAGLSHAEPSPVVVELFTSQGCSSCPPADALLARLGEREDVIPLALHVDYWDYIGWKDKFAKREFTRRQKGYARAGGWRSIYTPQVVVNGGAAGVGSDTMAVLDMIRQAERAPQRVQLSASREGNTLRFNLSPVAAEGVGPADVWLVRYLEQEQVAIRRGENAGRTITYSHIARSWDRFREWDGQSALAGTVTLDGPEPAVVLVQSESFGPILAAARVR